MLKVLVVCSIYALTLCHCANLTETVQTYMQEALLEEVNMGFDSLRADYQQKIHQLKTEATSCAINGNCSNILEEFEKLKKAIFHNAEQLKDFEKRSLQINHRQNNIRCFGCIADYIDEIFLKFCDEMEVELQPDIISAIIPPIIVSNATVGNATNNSTT